MNALNNTGEAREVLRLVLNDFCDAFNADRFTPILESDVSGYLYHRFVANGCPLNQLYLATRISGGIASRRRPDIVVGTLDRERASVEPLLIAELKVFQRWGHSDQQMRHRFSALIAEDLPSLEEFSEVLPIGRIAIVIDLAVSRQRRGYLTGTWDGESRLDLVRERCRDASIEFVWLHPCPENDEIVCDLFE